VGAANFLGSISAGIVEATVAGTWDRLKVCRDDACRWAFYDHSKNGGGAWCSMRVCGCRNKSRAYRARQKVSGGSGRG
jgi:predicted RNA-binding Zn ribbon-like protein